MNLIGPRQPSTGSPTGPSLVSNHPENLIAHAGWSSLELREVGRSPGVQRSKALLMAFHEIPNRCMTGSLWYGSHLECINITIMHYIKITKIHYIFILNISLGNIIQYIPATNKSFGHCSRGAFRLHKDDARFQIGELFYGFYPIQILSNRFSVLSLLFFFYPFWVFWTWLARWPYLWFFPNKTLGFV